MMNYVLSPSILAADFKVLGQEMKKTEENGAAYIHFDVMDGMFVPSISFGMPVLASIHDATEQFMDAHLMVQEPIRYVEAFQKAGADYVTVHLEACEDVKTTLDKIHACGMKAGLAVNPETDVKELVPYLEDVEMILIMSVHPGFGGQSFIESTPERITQLVELCKAADANPIIEVDGGINATTAPLVVARGADLLVAGSAVFKAADPVEAMAQIRGAHE